jgi:MFS family permease
MQAARQTTRDEWAQGWLVVLSASLGFSLFSVMLSAAGIFMQPLGQEFGWSRTTLSAGPAIATTMTAVLSPFFGILIDKYGSRKLALPGIVLTTLAMASFGFMTGSATLWIGMWVVFGFILVTIKSTVWSAAVANKFQKSRGLALGLVVAGTAVAQGVVPMLGNWLIEDFGWRQAYIWLAFGWGSITLLICTLFFRDGFSKRERAAEAERLAGVAPADVPGLSIPEAIRSPALWMILTSSFIVMAVTQGFSIHLFPILTESGIARSEAAKLLFLSGLAAVAGKLITGWLLDRFRPNWVGGLTLAACALAMVPLMDGGRSTALVVFAMLMNGYAIGTKTNITLFLAAEYGGMRNFGKIYGTISAIITFATALGPLIAGRLYDTSGSYDSFLMLGVIGCVIGGLMLIVLPSAPRWKAKEDALAEEFA